MVLSSISQFHMVQDSRQLGKYLKDYQSLVIEGEEPELVIGEYEKNDTKYWMFFNENISKEFHIEIEIKEPQLYLLLIIWFLDQCSL